MGTGCVKRNNAISGPTQLEGPVGQLCFLLFTHVAAILITAYTYNNELTAGTRGTPARAS